MGLVRPIGLDRKDENDFHLIAESRCGARGGADHKAVFVPILFPSASLAETPLRSGGRAHHANGFDDLGEGIDHLIGPELFGGSLVYP